MFGGTKMRIAGYCRVSTQEQAINGTSTLTQKAAIEAECITKNYELIEIYCDDGVSGKDDNRAALNKLRNDVKIKKIDVIMFTKLDRLGRSSRDLHNIAHEFHNLEVALYSIDQPFINEGGKFQFAMLGAFAEFERDTIKGRTDLGRKVKWKNRQSVIGSLPFGYKKVNGKAEIDEEQIKTYERIVSMYIDQNYSMKDIAVILTSEGIPLPVKHSKKKNSTWCTPTISDILKNESYTGETYQNKYVFELKRSPKSNKCYYAATTVLKDKSEWIKISFPALISMDRFQQIQKRIQLQKQKPKKHHSIYAEHFLAENILFCGYCGTRLTKRITREGTLKYVCFWYDCSKKELFLSNHNKCILRPILEAEADNYILHEIAEIITDPGNFAQNWLKNTDHDELKQRVVRLEMIEKELHEGLRDGFKRIQKTTNQAIRALYEDEQNKNEQKYIDAQSKINAAKKELLFSENKVDYLAEFQRSMESATKRGQFGIYFSQKAKFMAYLYELPFQERKRVVEAVISPATGGKYIVSYPTVGDVVDNIEEVQESEINIPLPNRGHMLVGDFGIDLNRLEAIITSLNNKRLLNCVVTG